MPVLVQPSSVCNIFLFHLCLLKLTCPLRPRNKVTPSRKTSANVFLLLFASIVLIYRISRTWCWSYQCIWVFFPLGSKLQMPVYAFKKPSWKGSCPWVGKVAGPASVCYWRPKKEAKYCLTRSNYFCIKTQCTLKVLCFWKILVGQTLTSLVEICSERRTIRHFWPLINWIIYWLFSLLSFPCLAS